MRDWRLTPLGCLPSTHDLDLHLDLGSHHTAYCRASVIELYLHIKFHWNLKNFVVDRLTASSRLRNTKSRTSIKNSARSNLDICSSLRISSHLPAAIVNGRGDRLGKGQFSELQKPCDFDLGLGHTAYRHASLIDLYLHSKFHWNRKKLFVVGRTYRRAYIHTEEHSPL